jgi:hypothetical protein
VRCRIVVVALVACSGANSSLPPPIAPRPIGPIPAYPLDAPPAPPPPGPRGAACSPERACAANLACLPLPGGYCGSPCGPTGDPCDGTCVATAREGDVCLARCTHDADCRAGEGYVCEAGACTLPNLAAIAPQTCPAAPGPAHDASFAPSEPWSAAPTPGIYQLEPSAALGPGGGLVALFATLGRTTDGNVLATSRIDAAGAATIGTPVGEPTATRLDPHLARDKAGTLHAVWLERGAGGEEIALATSTDGATWSAPVAVQDPGDCAAGARDCLDRPMIAIGPDPQHRAGEILYVMYAADGAGLRVRASRDGGATFSPAVTALAGSYGNAEIGADGRLHVVTIDGSPLGAFGSAGQRIQYTVSSDGGATFAPPATASAPDEMLPFFFANPSVAVDDRRGWLYLAYVRGGRDARWDLVIEATRARGPVAKWMWKRQVIGDHCAIHMVPNLALDDATGTLHVAWYDSDGGPGRFAHATCTPGAAACTQRGAINGVPFAALSTVRHGAAWIGPYASLVLDPQRHVLHAVWAQPVDEGGKVVARIFHAAASLNAPRPGAARSARGSRPP